MNGNTNMRDGCASRWAPLSYPSAVIFASHAARNIGGGAGRTADPYFPLHKDVLFAALRELLIIDGKIDPHTMEITPDGKGSKIEKDISRVPRNPTGAAARAKREEASHVIEASSDDDGKTIGSSPFKKQCTRNVSAESLRDQPSKECAHLVPISYAQFQSAEALAGYAVEQAILSPNPADNLGACQSETEKKRTDTEKEMSTSKRKVSDASDSDHNHIISARTTDFPFHILSLVRSNIMLLDASQTGSGIPKLAKLGETQVDTNDSNNSSTVDDIVSFLRHPKLQRENRHGSKRLFVLPSLLNVSIGDEYHLRAKAHHVVSSMIDSMLSFGNDMDDTSLRTFLGYKLSKSPSRDRILEIVSDVLFDVSHAMYAWIHTEEAMARTQGNACVDEAASSSINMQIRASLFDARALRRIGGFEPTSLLPLALGIRRCRKTNTSWKEYALSEEGKIAFGVHTQNKAGLDASKDTIGGDAAIAKRKRKIRSSVENDALLAVGKKRRGRRGKSMISCN